MKDPYDFIDWSPYSSSPFVSNHPYKQRRLERKQHKRADYSSSNLSALYLYNLAILIVLSILIITSIKQLFNL